MKRIGIGFIKLYRIVFAWLPAVVPVRADLFALHGAGDREVRPAARGAGWVPSASPAATHGIRVGMTRSASEAAALVTLLPDLRRIGPALLAVLLIWSSSLVARVRARAARPPARARAPVRRRPHPPLTPAQPGADPISLLAWLFTPIFQAMFIIMVAVYEFLESLGVPGAIGWAIVVLTLVVRTDRHPARAQAAGLAAPDAAPPARGQGDPEALQGRRDEGPRPPSRS